MKKTTISFRKRIVTIVALAVIIAVGAGCLVFYGILGVPDEKVAAKSTYSCISEISCSPILKEGSLYREGNIEFGASYLTSYVDKLDLNCKYDFISADISDISGVYTVNATLEGIYNNDVIWRKEYPLVKEQKFTDSQAEKKLVLQLQEYRDFIEAMEKETAIQSSVNMNISYSVDVSAQVAGKTVNEKSLSTLQFSVKDMLMQFSGEPITKTEKTIDEVITTETRLTLPQLIINIAVLAFAAVALVLVLLFTVGQKPDLAEKQLKKIFKQYGDRIIELEQGSDIKANNPIVVRTFRDLLLTADELKRPILKTGKDGYRDTIFYVMDDDRQYVYLAKQLTEKEEKEMRMPALSSSI